MTSGVDVATDFDDVRRVTSKALMTLTEGRHFGSPFEVNLAYAGRKSTPPRSSREATESLSYISLWAISINAYSGRRTVDCRVQWTLEALAVWDGA
jgi:hypothetical protein